MGFSGGGTNVLKPHKHSSAVQDGSPLNMNNVTEATLSAGDVIFSDGSALQRLAIGTPAQQIKVNAGATAPEYFTPAGGGATLTRSTAVSTTAQTTSSLTAVDATSFSAVLQAGVGMAVCWFGTSIEGSNDGFFQWDFSTDGTQPHLSLKTHGGRVPGQLTGISSTLSAQTAKLEFGMLAVGDITIQRDSYQGSMVILEIS